MPHCRPRPLLVVAFAAFVLPAQESKVEDPAVALIRGMLTAGATAQTEGEHEDARAILRKARDACLKLPGFAERKDAHDLLFEIGRTADRAADLRTAHDAFQTVCEYRTRTLPDDHHDLQEARSKLASTKYDLGDLRAAHALDEHVHQIRSRTLPDDHPDLQRARVNLAITKKALGDLSGARDLEEKAYRVFARTLPEDHVDLQITQLNLAATTFELGDLYSARSLEERLHEVRTRTLPADHPDLQLVRMNLATTKAALGDLAGAHALLESVREVQARTLPDDHPELQRTILNLGAAKFRLGALHAAHDLFEEVYGIRSRALPDDHTDLLEVQENLAVAKRSLGDLPGAHALTKKVYEIRSHTLPDDHPDLQTTRQHFAVMTRELGDLPSARVLEEKVCEVLSRILPDGHPDRQAARINLAFTMARLGDVDGARTLAKQAASAAQRRLASVALAPRELGAMAAQEQQTVDQLLTLAAGFGDVPAQPDLTRDALTTSQAVRGVQTRAARACRRARAADPQRAAALDLELRLAASEISRIVGEPLEGAGEALDASRRARVDRLSRAVQAKERLERELLALAARVGHVVTSNAGAAELAAALPPRSAAAAIVGFTHSAPDPEHPGRTISEARLAAVVLDREARIQLVPLGRSADVQTAIETLRNTHRTESARGLRPNTTTATDATEAAAAADKLRERVITPLLAACGPIDALYLAVDELLELVPLDALPLDADHVVGERIALRPLVSLFDLLVPDGASHAEAPYLLIGGGLDYGKAAEAAAMLVDSRAASPVLERAGEAGLWTQLPGTAREAAEIATLFAQTFPQGQTERFADEHAGKAQIARAAPRARFVHFATHGYFAPETVKSTADATTTRDAPGEGAITGLSPLALCGLALSGANLPPDDLGRHAGILTAEEILSLDLSHCYLVTLSACDTSLGARRAGQGYASLRAALQGAGARFVLTSLWKVGDEQTMELMVDFYRRLWVQKQDPHAALWEAKMEARRKGAPFRDWAGWVLTGK